MTPPDWALRGAAYAGYLVSRFAESRALMGPGADGWETLRRTALPAAERLFGDRVKASMEIDAAEYAGRLDVESAEAAEEVLWDAGFRRNPLAALKTRDGEPSLGSWAYRESHDAERQLHVTMFPAEEGGVDVYAHDEYSSINPDVAEDHYTGETEADGVGVERVRDRLPVEPAPTPGPLDIDRPSPDRGDRLVNDLAESADIEGSSRDAEESRTLG